MQPKPEAQDECAANSWGGKFEETETARQWQANNRAWHKKHRIQSAENSVGLDLSREHPKTSARNFVTRYLARDPTPHDFRYVLQAADADGKVSAELHGPYFNRNIYVGMPSDTEKEAEKSAAELFSITKTFKMLQNISRQR